MYKGYCRVWVTRPIISWGATTAEKLRGGDQGLGPNTGKLASRARPKAGLGVGCGRGSPPPAVRVRGITSENFSKTHAKSCILVILAVKFLAFWKLRPRSWGTNTSLIPNWPVSPGPYGCCAYDYHAPSTPFTPSITHTNWVYRSSQSRAASCASQSMGCLFISLPCGRMSRLHGSLWIHNTIQYKTCNAPYVHVTKMLFVGAGMTRWQCWKDES